MKEFFSKKKNIVIISVIVAILVIVAGVIAGVNIHKKKVAKLEANTQKSKVITESKKKILENEKQEKEDKEYEEKYTEQYKIYEQLSDKEKKEKEVIPKKYEVNYDVIEDIIEEQKEDKDSNYKLRTPKKYNLADKIDIKVEDQGEYGLCWDFAATKSLETNLALTKNKKYDLSEMHVNYVTSDLLIGSREIDDAGNFSIYENYLVDSGAVLEEQVGYNDYSEEYYKDFLDMKDVVTVTKTVNFPTIYKSEYFELSDKEIDTVRNAIKNHIMNYGSVYAEVAMEGYNEGTNTLYCSPKDFALIDHAISIVGWDDNYPKENFPEENRPNSNGAYIALNSWGEGFGENGYFYISYEDQNIEYAVSGIVSTSYEDAYEVDKIKNNLVKDIIYQRLSNTIKEYNGKKYVTRLALAQIYDIDLENTYIESLSGIDIFENLMHINLGKTSISNIKPLSELKQLSYANLSNTGIRNVSALKDTNLIYLDVSNNIDVKGYDKIEKLEQLYLKDCNIKEISNLNNLKNLEILDLSENKELENINELNLDYLWALMLTGCNIDSITQISNLYRLSKLDLSYNNLENIDGIEDFNYLQYIDLSGNSVQDFSKIAKIETSPEYMYDDFIEPYITLVVEDANIKNISVFSNLNNVSSLYLAKNNITDLSGFYNNSVYELDLSENKNLSNIQYLRNLQNLSALYLEECDIDDVSEISKINNLYALDLAKNNISNINKLNSLEYLEALSLAENNNLEGKLSLHELFVLSLYGSDFEENKFSFNKCTNLEEINIGNINNDKINSILNDDFDNLYFIVLYDTIITNDILETIQSKNLYLVGGEIVLKESEDSNIIIKDNNINIESNKEIGKVIRPSVQYREISILGGIINSNLKEINLNENSSRTIIDIYYGRKIEDFKITIEIKEQEKDTIVEQETDSKKETKKEDKTEEKQDNNSVNELDDDYQMVDG